MRVINSVQATPDINMDSKTSHGLMGAVAGVIAAAILQPLENIKVAMMLPPRDLKLNHRIVHNLAVTKRYIYEHEGLKGFFKGVVASSLRAAFGSFAYFSLLRHLQKAQNEKLDFYLNFFNSLVARMISTVVSNPLSVVETRYEVANFHGYSSIADAFIQIKRKQGYGTFFKGGLASCLKEGVFGGLYYMLYEEIKYLGYSKPIAGIMSGLISTAASHPLEIIRAELMTEGIREGQHRTVSLWRELRQMSKERQLFKGLAPRLLKKPLGNTITFCLFEVLEENKQRY